jgi:transposase
MSDWIKENFNIYIQPKTIQKRLYRANFSWKTNRPSPYKGDPEKQDEFKKNFMKKWKR